MKEFLIRFTVDETVEGAIQTANELAACLSDFLLYDSYSEIVNIEEVKCPDCGGVNAQTEDGAGACPTCHEGEENG